MPELNGNSMRLTLRRMVDDSYSVEFGADMFPRIAEDLRRTPMGSKYAVVTDSNVERLYAGPLKEAFEDEGIDADVFSFPAGEESKTADTCMGVIGEMSKAKYGRDSAIVALGGGVVGDMAGFIAAMFNRGVPYIQVPTTLLAQADSSVGGKAAVDTKYGKNLVGAFKQPKRVYIDVATLGTLPEREYRSGLAETIKHGIILDGEFFGYLEENLGEIMGRDRELLLHIAKNNCRIKGTVVEIDPNEKGLRRILNYGHTAGHAIEKISGFALSHGEAVSIGMMVAGRIANQMGYFPAQNLERQRQLLCDAGLPIVIPHDIPSEEIIGVTTVDKKARGGRARYVLPSGIGTMHQFGGDYATFVERDVVMRALEETR